MRRLFFIALAAVALSAAWSYRGVLLGAAAPEPPARPITWDNGSVRQPPTYRQLPPHEGPGGLRRCTRGAEVTYSNMPCPAGWRTAPVSGDRFSVIESPRPPGQASAPAPAHQRLQEALDLKRDPELRQRMIDGAVGR